MKSFLDTLIEDAEERAMRLKNEYCHHSNYTSDQRRVLVEELERMARNLHHLRDYYDITKKPVQPSSLN